MSTLSQGRRMLEALPLTQGLERTQVHYSLGQFLRLGDVGQRGAAFYLLEVQERRLYERYGAGSVLDYARAHFSLTDRRTRELLAVARKLRDLPRLDRAFREHEIGWTRVLLVAPVASPEHEEAWVREATTTRLAELRTTVRRSPKGGPPREKGDAKGLSPLRYPERIEWSTAEREMIEQAKKKLSDERDGAPVTTRELVAVSIDLFLDLTAEGKAKDGKGGPYRYEPRSKYTIHISSPAPEDGDQPLMVDDGEKVEPLSCSTDPEVIERNRDACARCDGEYAAACEHDHEREHDIGTPPAKRRRVLKRDKNRCRNCGSTRRLHVHHIKWRSRGGRTRMWQMLTLCERCHSMVHEGLLVLEGGTQRQVVFKDRDGNPVHRPGRTMTEEERLKILGAVGPPPGGGTGPGKVATLDDVPSTVDPSWWKRHRHLIDVRRDGGLVFHAGLPEEEDAPSCDGSCRAAEAEDSGQAPADGAVQDDVWHDETAAAPAKPRGPCPCRRKKDEPQGDPAPFREAFGDLVGMETVLGQIETEVQGARALGRPFPHTLFQGPPGTGKTTLARGIARVMGARMVEQTGPMLQDVPAALSALTSLEEGDVLFVDEIHAVPPAVREIFYEALAQRRVELRFRNGLHDKTVRMALPAFTLVAATTEGHGLSEALRSRFGLHARLDTYTEAALAALAHAQAEKKGLEVSEEATERLARAAGGTPRELLRLVDRIESYVAAEGRTAVDDDVGRAALARQGVDEHGLRPEDRIVLRALVSCGGPVGLVRLATLARVAREQILADVEPRLVRGGWMRVTPDGRVPGPRLVAAGPLAEAI